MTELTITASQVLPGTTGATFEFAPAGAVITAGQVVYLDATTNTYKLFDANDTAANTRAPRVALNGGSAGQPIKTQITGTMTLGAAAAMTAGLVYVAGATPGSIAPNADVVTGWRVAIIGTALTASTIALHNINSGATK